MSRLRELMEELCPNGVEYKKLGDVGTLVRGKRFVKNDFADIGVPAIHYGEMYTYYGISSSESKTKIRAEISSKMRYAQTNDVIIVGAGETVEDIGIGVAWLGKDDVAVHDACYIFRHNMNPIYVSYLLRTESYHKQIKKYITTGKISSISAQGLAKAIIPVPPVTIQNEIVKVLDNFTKATTELTEKLAAELEMQKKQYNFYRDSLLNFVRVDDTIVQTDRQTDRQAQRISKKRRVGDIATFRYGYTASAATGGDARYIRITDITEDGTLNPFDARYTCVSPENSEYLLKRGDLVMARTGATYGKTLFYDSDAPAIYASFLIKIQVDEAQILPRFYWHFTRTTEYWTQADRLVTKGGQPQFNTGAIGRVNIPIPPLEIQKKIVSILDRFDTLCGNLTRDLSAEIAARKKQYEHYRDKLLTFPRSNG